MTTFELLRMGITLILEIVLFLWAFVATILLLRGYERGFDVAVVALLWMIFVRLTEMEKAKGE